MREEKRERERRVRGEGRGGMGGEGSRNERAVQGEGGLWKGAYKTTERTAEPRNGSWRIRHNW